MNKYIKKLKTYSLPLYWAIVFVVAAVLLYLILPGEHRFKYEYQKGFPWNHENLLAPFDFAILKTSAEIEKEKNEQLKNLVPYFTFDTAMAAISINRLNNDLKPFADSIQHVNPAIISEITSTLEKIYQTGILLNSIETYPELTDKKELKKRTGNNTSRIKTESLYSEKSAYNELNNRIHELAVKNPDVADFLYTLQPEKYVEANLIYDEVTSRKEQDEISRSISSTRGMVQSGERIILSGEIVNDEKYQILESLKLSYESERTEGLSRYTGIVGKGILIAVFTALLFTFLYLNRRDILTQFNKLSFLLLFMLGMIFLTIVINSFPDLHIYLVPFAIFPILIHTFFDSRTAVFTLVITTLLIGFYAPNNYEFVLLETTAGMVAVFSLNKMYKRGHLVWAAVWVLLTSLLVFTALEWIFEGSFLAVDYKMFKWFLFSSLLILLTYPLVFVFEKIFGFVSDVTLIELSDTNQPVLRKLAEEAPGTFQHSMQIANLGEEIILKIGGNPFLIRAGALYHDIGKIGNPGFFIENQMMGINPHDKMDYLKSAEVIINHVKNGVSLAKKYNLPEAIIEFIATHHGTTKAKYFYLKHKEENPGTEVNEQLFTYPGPLPKSKEAAVVMLVDGIEAASRSLKEKTHEALEELINNMVDQKIHDKQLEESQLTFRDIKIIKETLLSKLLNIYHVRIEYPKETNENRN